MYRVEIKRRMGEADIAAVSRLLSAAASTDSHAALGEHNWLDMVHGGRLGISGLVAWAPGHGHPVGYAQVSKGENSWAVEYVVHPHHRSSNDVAIELVAAALAQVANLGGGHIHLWVPKPTEQSNEVAQINGLSRGRDLYQMRRSLPSSSHADLDVRSFEIGRDECAWLELNNSAFAWHPEQGNWDLKTLEKRQTEQWFDPAGFLLHETDGKLDAFCWTKIHTDEEPPVGEIYVIAVDPNSQGKRLGRNMALAGLDYLAGKGLKRAMLYVDASNERATSLYNELGFTLDHIDRAYVGDIPAAQG